MEFEISCEKLKELLDHGEKVIVLDVRENFEYETANIHGLHIPMHEIPTKLDLLKRDDHIVVHCHHGGRSAQVAQYLKDNGYEKVQNLSGGIDQWSIEIDSSIPRY